MYRLLLIVLFISSSVTAQVSEEWKRFFSGNGNDRASADYVIAEQGGNSYFRFAGIDSSYKLIKFDVNGNTIWEKEYNFPIGALHFESHGKIISVGTDNSEVIVSKIDTSGNVIWTSNSNSPEIDQPRISYLDSSDNIYVSGGIQSDLGSDIMTYKFTGDGNLIFARRFNGSLSSSDYANSVTTDHAGNVYVGGIANESSFSGDFILLKYGPSGNIKWERYYNTGGYDRINSVLVDNSNNILVKGMSDRPSDYNLSLTKYDSSGNVIWQKDEFGKETNGNGLIVDEYNNIYIQARFNGELSILKYNSQGNLQRIIHGENLYMFYLNSFHIDTENNYYTINYGFDTSMHLAKYDSAGAQIYNFEFHWNQSFIGYNITGDNIFLTGGLIPDEDGNGMLGAAISRVELSNGSPDWKKIFHGNLLSEDYASSMVKNSQGDLIITGYNRTDSSFSTIKYRSDGALVWKKNLNNDWIAVSQAMASDPEGNIIVTGYSQHSLSGIDLLTVKYDSSGNEKWIKEYSGDTGRIYKPVGVICDDSRNVYVAGTQTDISGNIDWITIKYDENGTEQWFRNINGGASGQDLTYDITLDSKNNILVSGSVSGISSGVDASLVKYGESGNLLWMKTYSSSGIHNDIFRKVRVDSLDNIYVCGETFTEGFSDDYILIKYDRDGNVIWEKKYNSPSNLLDHALVMEISKDKIYVSGESFSTGNSFDILTVEYDSAGNEVWNTRYAGSFARIDKPGAISFDNNGSVYVVGEETVSNGNRDFVTIKYDSAGNQKWRIIYSNQFNSNDTPSGIIISDQDEVYVSGTSAILRQYYTDIILLKYSALSGIQEPSATAPLIFHLYNNYPNPFNPSTRIKFDLPADSKVELKIYDVTGKEVSELVNNNLASGTYEFVWNAENFSSGIYFYKLKVNNSGKDFIESKRMILLK